MFSLYLCMHVCVCVRAHFITYTHSSYSNLCFLLYYLLFSMSHNRIISFKINYPVHLLKYNKLPYQYCFSAISYNFCIYHIHISKSIIHIIIYIYGYCKNEFMCVSECRNNMDRHPYTSA